MRLITYFSLLLSANYCGAINRPVYKIILTQKGYTQFLQYDIDTPPLREFTFCTWIKFRDLTRDQTLFNYIVHGNEHILRLWLDSGGRYMKISIKGKTSSSNRVDLVQDVWQHMCLSYQSDYGAWALYMDSRLVSCEVSPSLQGFILPAGGSVIIGYGTSNDGVPGGLEGEIFGANMILSSTIERNHTMKRNPKLRQKYFHRNKVTGSNDINYIILNDMQSATSHQDFETTTSIPSSSQSYVSIRTPFSVVEHDVGSDLTSRKNADLIKNKVNWGDPVMKKVTNDDDKISFRNIMDGAKITRTFKEQPFNFKQLSDGPSVSLYEAPPPVGSVSEYSRYSTGSVKEHFGSHNMSKFTRKTVKLQNLSNNMPPTFASMSNNAISNSRSNTNFANSVLNFLKHNSINIKVDHKKVPPPTIPLFKISDSFPYASEFKAMKTYTPYIFQRKNIFDKPYRIMKRDVQKHQINVQVIQNDYNRNEILKHHANLNPTNVEVMNWGELKRNKDVRVYRNTENASPEIILSDVFKPRPFSVALNNNKTLMAFESRKKSINNILPFIKSIEQPSESMTDLKMNQNDIYTRSLSTPNKWHNVKSYNNDYSPRRIQTELSDNKNKMEMYNKKLPSIRLKYIPDNHKIVKNIDEDILKGRDLALKVSNISESLTDSVSILKYNHGFLPSTSKKRKQSQFDQNTKIGNALNERAIIGDDDIQKYRSFVGGNEKGPDINSYRSDLDNVNEQVPPSLGSKICKNLELFDRLLYIQPDGSIDVTQILSPVKEKNLGIAFVILNYKKCALQESIMEDHSLLFIDWSNTPVRLFGGAKPKKTTDLCGFF